MQCLFRCCTTPKKSWKTYPTEAARKMKEKKRMQQFDLMKARHSVRQYTDRPIEKAALTALRTEIDECNEESGLHIQLVTNEPKAFDLV